MPLYRRLPKRGFSNDKFAREFNIVNIGQLETRFESGVEITAENLYQNNLIKRRDLPVKILGDGKLTKKFNVQANVFSKSAAEKIKTAGGSIKQI